jgi:hypothetical protein
MRAADVNPDFPDPRTNRLHRLPVVGIQSLLHAAQLKAGEPPC